MHRYLLNVSYMGKPFRGAQRQVTGVLPRQDDPSTVQGQLEMALKNLNPENDPCVFLSSRTDTGVNALHSTCHVDLLRRNNEAYNTLYMTSCLNKYFNKSCLPIRVIRTYLVPESFHCRHNAISRTYLYRLAVIKGEVENVAPVLQHIPIEELERCWFLCTNNFNLAQMNEAISLLKGFHDFRTFMGKGSKHPDIITRKNIERLGVSEVQPMVYSDFSWPKFMYNDVSDYKYYNIYIQSRGFLQNQVRRTVGCLAAASQGKICIKDIKLMLEVPSRNSWNPRIKLAPSHGLYLCEVEYHQNDIKTFTEVVQD